MKKTHISTQSGGILPPEGPLGTIWRGPPTYIEPGMLMRCPTCDTVGNYDDMLSGKYSNEPMHVRAIWYDEEYEMFECFRCCFL